jgi:pseudouridylate synthase
LERIDKIIASQGQYSRKEVKALIAKRRIAVDGRVVSSSSEKADPMTMLLTVDGKPLEFKRNLYLVLNKPKGYVSATEDREHPTVLELVPQEYRGRDLFPAGRLDRDTTGLMIITDDGVLAHNILAPKKHVPKRYHVELDIPVTEEMRLGFSEGVMLNDGVCKAADLIKTGEKTAEVTLREGRYHQIKRMFGCFGAEVVELKRLGMGKLTLPEDLAEGECREMSEEELALLQEK